MSHASLKNYRLKEEYGCTYVTNKNGDVLYEATGLTEGRIMAMARNGEYTDWRQHRLAMDPPNTRGMGGERIFNRGKWFEEGDNVVDVLEKHPKRTYKDCVLMATMEGLRIDECGILRRIVE
jgi:hypothetical protein